MEKLMKLFAHCCLVASFILITSGGLLSDDNINGHKLNWYKWAHVYTYPLMMNLNNLCDNDLQTVAVPHGDRKSNV